MNKKPTLLYRENSPYKWNLYDWKIKLSLSTMTYSWDRMLAVVISPANESVVALGSLRALSYLKWRQKQPNSLVGIGVKI